MAAITFGRVPDVPICETGTWHASTGEITFTVEDFAAAVKAYAECPSVRNPAIWLGHTHMQGKPTNGLPAIGWLDGIRLDNDGHTLVADYEGLPGWLVETDDEGHSILASAYPDRSIEGEWAHVCTIGHTHDFVITGIALLGVEAPAVGTLTSLQDIAAIWGVTTDDTGTVAASTPPAPERRVFAVTPKETLMAKPVLATVSVEDIRRTFYADAAWDEWIREVDVDPAQIIVETEDGLVRRPYTISGDDIVFGDPVPVVTEYRDKTVAAQLAAAHLELGPRTVCATYATRETSRLDTPAPTKATTPKETGMDPKLLRESLGLAEDASDVEVQAALATAGVIPKVEGDPVDPPKAVEDPAPAPVPVAATQPTDGPKVVSIDSGVLADLQAKAALGEKAHRRQTAEDRQRLVDAAAADGRIKVAQKQAWLSKLEAEGEDGEKVLASLEKGLVPIEAVGHSGSGEDIVGDLLDDELISAGLAL